jgi:hypothetical protein
LPASLAVLPNTLVCADTGYAAQSILAALGCIQFVCNIAFAALVLKEKVSSQVQDSLVC